MMAAVGRFLRRGLNMNGSESSSEMPLPAGVLVKGGGWAGSDRLIWRVKQVRHMSNATLKAIRGLEKDYSAAVKQIEALGEQATG